MVMVPRRYVGLVQMTSAPRGPGGDSADLTKRKGVCVDLILGFKESISLADVVCKWP